MKRSLLLTALLLPALLLGGCAVLSVAGAAAGAAISVTGAVVSTGISVSGKVVGAGIDALSGADAEDPPKAKD